MARLAAFVGARGNEGILGRDDCKVVPLDTPGASIRVNPGAAIVTCRTANYPYQSYAGANGDADVVSVVANTSGATRYDLVVLRVEDPWLPTEPWPSPADVAVGPYLYTRVLTNVGLTAASTRKGARDYLRAQGYSAIPLAGMTLPNNTSTIDASRITWDLRSIANPRRDDKGILPFNPSTVANVTASTSAWADWVAPAGWVVDVPEWATLCTMVITVHGVRLDRVSTAASGTANGNMRGRLGGTSAAPAAATQATAYDLETTASNVVGRYTLGAGDTFAVPAALRGATGVPVAVQGVKAGGTKNIYSDAGTAFLLSLAFSESPL